MLLGFSLWVLGDSHEAFTPLEARPIVRAAGVVVRGEDVVDVAHIFYGSEAFGRDPIASESAHPRSYRSELQLDPGHFTWLVLSDRPSRESPLRTLGAQGLRPGSDDSAQFEASLNDGVLNFFYDLGGDERTFIHNWSTVGVQELQMSPLLPWSKKLDFIVLSSIDPAHCAALDYILGRNPDILIFGPPLPTTADPQFGPQQPVLLEDLGAARRYHAFEVGLHALTDRLALFVYAGDEGVSHVALIIRSGDHTTLLAGVGVVDMASLIGAAEEAGAPSITGFIGATGYDLGDDQPTIERLGALSRSHPRLRIAPGYGTSLEGFAMLVDVFGAGRVSSALLGARIPLSNF